MAGKLGGRDVTAAATSPGRPGRLALLIDVKTNVSFLVDTGSVYSIIPHHSNSTPTGPAITTANGKPIQCWGTVVRTVHVGHTSFQWTFLLAAISFHIVGADFLENFGLSVDLKRRRLVDEDNQIIELAAPMPQSTFAMIGVRPAAEKNRPTAPSWDRSTTANSVKVPSGSLAASVPGGGSARASPGYSASRYTSPSSTSSTSSSLVTRQGCGTGLREGVVVDAAGVGQDDQRTAGTQGGSHSDYQQLLLDFPAVTNLSKKLPTVIHKVQHHIETVGRPVSAKYRRLDAEKLAAAKAEFQEMERQGIVRRSDSSWASPLHMVKKSDGTWRPCGDFRRLNVQTQPDRYTCPNIGDLTARLAGCKVFSKLDLRKGYHQVPVRPADIKKTAIITPFGLFEFLRMPFGLRNAGQTFQRMMDNVLGGLECAFVYLDDVLVASSNHQEHTAHLKEVLSRLQRHGLVLNAEKCQLGVSELDYLGHHVTASGIQPIADRVATIKKFPQPKTVGQLQTYLGMVNFYRRFLPAAARVLKPLTDALKGGQKGTLDWTVEMGNAFQHSKQALYNAVELGHPDPKAELFLAVDASETHVGAVLQQTTRGEGTRPLAFFSAKLDTAQTKYSAFDRELLAVYLSIRHFKWILEGRVFYVLSDHKPLSFALGSVTDAWSARRQRHLS